MGYTHYVKSVDSPSSLEDALKIREQISKVLDRNKKFIQYESGLPYAPENSITFDKDDNAQNLVRFNGIGDDGHETFYINSGFEDGFNFCKTNRKSYDLAVCECLIIFKHFLNADVSSDGFSSYQSDMFLPYKDGDIVRDVDVDGMWAVAAENINNQLGTKYKFVCTDVDNRCIEYTLKNIN